MLNFFLRRVQRFVLPIKIIGLIGSIASLVCLVFRTPPEVGTIVVFGLLLFTILALVFSFLFSVGLSLLAATSISFFLFLKAVDLMSPLNIGLFVVFLILLGVYFRKHD